MKVKALPIHVLCDVNENMYQNVLIVSQRSRELISETSIDLNKIDEGFDSTDEIQEVVDFDPNVKKSIVSAVEQFVNNDIEWKVSDSDKEKSEK
ncbi:MAG: hypothetical protein CMG00_04730 [Candidatus Marinimicrobia bacterium]|nr:hypothetical protein [Candidatus Neomarinimicrobiota bacterium]|tara:strand:- start:3557 stop:3838 length:282 start_codon:yes stop_codon:yes gene_type:complete